MSWEEVRKLSF